MYFTKHIYIGYVNEYEFYFDIENFFIELLSWEDYT